MWKYFFGLFLGTQIGHEKVVYRYRNIYIIEHNKTLKNNQMDYRFNK